MIVDALCEGLACAFLDGDWTPSGLQSRARLALAARPRWLRGLSRRMLARFAQPPADLYVLALEIAADEPLARALQRAGTHPQIRRWFLPAPQMVEPPAALGPLALPQLPTLGDLAAALDLSPAELAWFADAERRNTARSDPRLQHYCYRWLPKRAGGYRLLEQPKPRMKRIQRWLLRAVLSPAPIERSAHGFVAQRSVLSFVAPHTGREVVLRLDLESFFASITLPRVRALFCTLGYPRIVASALAGLCCVPTPEAVLRANPDPDPAERYRLAQGLRVSHLPQGAPTSPALSNLIAFRLDRRLVGLARAAGYAYSRYADDLAFSGDRSLARGAWRFATKTSAIAQEEGFALRYRKLRLMRGGGRQTLAGLVVNARPNVPRREYDALRAIVHNAAKHGPASQNRAGHADFRAHLQGRIAWLAQTSPSRAARLRQALARVAW